MLKAVASPLRLQTLNLLFDKGPLSYTELMGSLKMNPSRDAGRFAYHLKFLLKADLVEADVEARKYLLSDLGKMVIEVAERIDRKALKQKSPMVRGSRFALEEFDANKIANSLVKEAKMPADLAQRIAKEAERELLKSKIKYLTAPLVREIVNALLIEKGLEEYRHKLTRLGLPVHDVTRLIESMNHNGFGSTSVQEKAGERVLEEYMLLSVLPRDIGDAHISGAIHIDDMNSWILKPAGIVHDLRFFFQKGLDSEISNGEVSGRRPTDSLASAMDLTFNVLLRSSKEVSGLQIIEYFNVFLAPFARSHADSEIKEQLRRFVANVGQYVNACLSLELTIPEFLAQKSTAGVREKDRYRYGDFLEQSQQLASLLLDVLAEGDFEGSAFRCRFLVKIRTETFTDPRAKAVLLKAHNLAARRGGLFFAYLPREIEKSVFSPLGTQLAADFHEDWEIDTLRTGHLGAVTLNLPRIAYESERDQAKFLSILKERLEMAVGALEIQSRALIRHGKDILPFLAQRSNGDQYFRLENCSGIIDLVGFNESMRFFCDNGTEDQKELKFSEMVTKTLSTYLHKTGRRHRRLSVAVTLNAKASHRLVQLDIEKYGVGRIQFSGSREKPYYSTSPRIELSGSKTIPEISKIGPDCLGDKKRESLLVVELGDAEFEGDDLYGLTRQLVEAGNRCFFVYDRKLTYCESCQKTWFGLLFKCPGCGSMDSLVRHDEFGDAC